LGSILDVTDFFLIIIRISLYYLTKYRFIITCHVCAYYDVIIIIILIKLTL